MGMKKSKPAKKYTEKKSPAGYPKGGRKPMGRGAKKAAAKHATKWPNNK